MKGDDRWLGGQRERSHGTAVRPWGGTRMCYFAQRYITSREKMDRVHSMRTEKSSAGRTQCTTLIPVPVPLALTYRAVWHTWPPPYLSLVPASKYCCSSARRERLGSRTEQGQTAVQEVHTLLMCTVLIAAHGGNLSVGFYPQQEACSVLVVNKWWFWC